MTTQSKKTNQLEFEDALTEILKPYSPAGNITECDKECTTPELINAIELHLGIPQGDSESAAIDGAALVEYMKILGYKCINTGGLQLQWLLKKKA